MRPDTDRKQENTMPPQAQPTTPTYSVYPTSPWTDVYQPVQPTQAEQPMPSAPQFDGDDQQPTHDALSDAYTD
jgi:hypothetical protein